MILSGHDLRWYVETGSLKIEPVKDDQFQQNGVDLVLEKMAQYHKGFHLGATRETLTLPDSLMAFVEIRSSWARQGFFLPPTIVDAGFHGNLTLEILFVGNPIHLKPGMIWPVGQRFAHLIFAKTTSPCEPYAGRYQGQSGITPAR